MSATSISSSTTRTVRPGSIIRLVKSSRSRGRAAGQELSSLLGQRVDYEQVPGRRMVPNSARWYERARPEGAQRALRSILALANDALLVSRNVASKHGRAPFRSISGTKASATSSEVVNHSPIPDLARGACLRSEFNVERCGVQRDQPRR
jgi:hypothetical protein